MNACITFTAKRSLLIHRTSLIKDAVTADGRIFRLRRHRQTYVQESNSADAIRLVSADTAPYALTHWQEIEVRTAIRLERA